MLGAAGWPLVARHKLCNRIVWLGKKVLYKRKSGETMETLYMETQVGLKMIALTLFLHSFFYFLSAAALCHDFSLVDSGETKNAKLNSH